MTPSRSAPIFDSAHAAVTFAMRYSARGMSPTTPMTQLLPGKRLGRGTGLHGYAGAAQAGMVLRLIGTLPIDQAAVLRLRFGYNEVECRECGTMSPDAAWLAAAQHVAGWPELAGVPPQALRAAVATAAGLQRLPSTSSNAEAQMSDRTLRERVKATRDRIAALELAAMAAIDARLTESGTVGEVASA